MNDKYSQLLDILNISDDTSGNKLQIISASLVGKKIELESLGLIVNNESEGLRIDLSRQHFCIYKTKEDAITYCTERSFDEDILIVEDSKIWTVNSSNQTDVFIENIRLWFEYKNILLDKIADYVNKIDYEFILLSADKGKIDIGFSRKPIKYFDNKFKQKTSELELSLRNDRLKLNIRQFGLENWLFSLKNQSKIIDNFSDILSLPVQILCLNKKFSNLLKNQSMKTMILLVFLKILLLVYALQNQKKIV
jgi:hypothetical protein